MLVPVSWLKQYVPVGLLPDDLAHLLTLSGTEIGAIRNIGSNWAPDKVVVGRVENVNPHPNADRLKLPTVDIGEEESVTVVCGATNVAPGQKIAFAKEGSMLYNYRSKKLEPLKSTKIRGFNSVGMVSSELELGLSEEHEGILVLPDDAPVGMPLVEYLGDTIFDAEITPNRPDCLSIIGIAREVAAITGLEVTEPPLDYQVSEEPIESHVTIEVSNPELCPRYSANVITGVEIGPSPYWLQNALAKMGQRSINNVVDVTNYVMLEYGQPLHAFDLDLIQDKKVVVRMAREGETIVTLDDETLNLKPPMLAITDSRGPIALPGIGGTETAVSDSTKSILLEAANFDPINTRRMASDLNQKTESFYRFERSISPDLVGPARQRATRLIIEVAGGIAANGTIDMYPGKIENKQINLSAKRVGHILGMKFTERQLEKTLAPLGFNRVKLPTTGKARAMAFSPPYWRSDISIEADLIEEVARMIGYDKIPTTALSAPIPHHGPKRRREIREQIRDLMVATGMQETISHSVTNPKILDWVGAMDEKNPPLKLFNPMSTDLTVLRTSLRGSILQTLQFNRRVIPSSPIRIFEIGNVYIPNELKARHELPDEKEYLVGVLSGFRFGDSWNVHSTKMDFFDAKGVLNALEEEIGLPMDYVVSGVEPMHPGKAAEIRCYDAKIGIVGEVHPSVLDSFDINDRPVAMFEIDLECLYEAMNHGGKDYSPVSRFPEAHRDVAIVVDSGVASRALQRIIDRHKLVKESIPIDIYEGQGIATGKKSVAYKIIFQSDKATLTTGTVDKAQGDILRQLEREFGAELRR